MTVGELKKALENLSDAELERQGWPVIWPLMPDDSCDFFVTGGPTENLVSPTNPAAFERLRRFSSEETYWLGHSLVVKMECVDDLIVDLEGDGFSVRLWEEYESDLVCEHYRDLERLGDL
jgi:hypothetical protein